MCHRGRFSRLLARAGARNRRYPPLFWTEANRGISGGFIPHQGMGIFRTETALFWTFAENMRDYTPNGLRVQNTGFFQKIITPGNRAFSRVRTVGRFNPAPVHERFPPQLFQRYRLQTEPPPFWLIYPRTVGRANFPPGANFSKVNYIYFMGCNNYLNQWSNKTIKQ